MKEKAFGSECVYPSIFNDYFLEAIYESGYKDKVIYKDLDNLSINLLNVKVNMYSVNIFLSTIFKHYKKVKFSVLQVKKEYHTNYYQLYNAKIAINYKGVKWLMNLNVCNAVEGFLIGAYQTYTLKNLKKKIMFKQYKREELLVDLFYRIINNLSVNARELYNLYLLYYDNINFHDLGISLENIFKVFCKNINCDSIAYKINKLRNNRTLKNKWILFKTINENINIEYEDIMCAIYLIYLKLKERTKKSL